MLAVDGVELAAGFLEAAGVQIGKALIVEHVGRIGLLDIGGEIDVACSDMQPETRSGDAQQPEASTAMPSGALSHGLRCSFEKP